MGIRVLLCCFYYKIQIIKIRYCSLRSQQHASRCRKYEPPCAMPKEYRLLRKLNLC